MDFLGPALFMGFAMYGLLLFPALLLSFAIPYAVLRLRSPGEAEPDGQVGLRAALAYFYSLGLIIFLTGLTVLFVDILTREGNPQGPRPAGGVGVQVFPEPKKPTITPAMRSGSAMMVSGLFFSGLHVLGAFLVRGGHGQWRRVRRIFAGWRLAIHGLVVLLAGTVLLSLVFQEDFDKGETWRMSKVMFAVLAVWVPSWIVQFVLLMAYSIHRVQPEPVAVQPAAPSPGGSGP
jgi:hypothetical protein